MLRIVADLGNSRLKWGRLDERGALAESCTLAIDERDAWDDAWKRWNPKGERTAWAVATVNPPVAKRLETFISGLGNAEVRWYRSAGDVSVRHVLEHPETAGVDRALAVAAAVAMHPGRAGLVVSCGSAVTVERVDAEGVWQGGAIAPGLALSARALHLLTAQLPLILPRSAPPAWGQSTRPALEAGLYWGTVGAIRELVARQSADMPPNRWLVWTGGDAPVLAPAAGGDDARVFPDLVLQGLARFLSAGG
jgi:type III pantothenate kinase